MAALVLAPILFLAFRLLERRDRTLPGGWLLQFVPMIATALVTGLLCGYLLKSSKHIAWSVGTGALVALASWSTARWYEMPPISELLSHGAQAAVAGAAAGLTCWFWWRRRRTRDMEVPDAAA